jgi:hypothetical protein
VRPVMAEGLPSQSSLYQIIPWEHTKTGDLLKHKDPEVHVSDSTTSTTCSCCCCCCCCCCECCCNV